MRILWAILRIIFGLAALAAIVGQLMASVARTEADGRTVALVVANYFSFFTIDSNSLTVVVLLMGAFFLITRRGDDTQWFTVLRLVLTTYMATTGIVYNLLLRNIVLPQGSEPLPWSNEILHLIGPIYIVLDWLLAPGRIPLPYWKSIRTVVIFPIIWAIYTLIRGPFTPNEIAGTPYWYPYPFLDPNLSPNGYLSVAFYVILIAVIIGLVAALAIWVSRRKVVAIMPGQPQPSGTLPKG